MNTKINQRRARALTFMLSLGMLAGILIWAKLRLVTDIPRSALAEPREVERPVMEPGESEGQTGDDLVDSVGNAEGIVDQVIDTDN